MVILVEPFGKMYWFLTYAREVIYIKQIMVKYQQEFMYRIRCDYGKTSSNVWNTETHKAVAGMFFKVKSFRT